MKCAIKWIDKDGWMTPDENEAIGHVYCEAYTVQPSTTFPDGYNHEKSDAHPICAEHLKRLSRPGMHHWKFIPFGTL